MLTDKMREFFVSMTRERIQKQQVVTAGLREIFLHSVNLHGGRFFLLWLLAVRMLTFDYVSLVFNVQSETENLQTSSQCSFEATQKHCSERIMHCSD